MGRKYASRLVLYQSDTSQACTIDIILTSTSAETTTNQYTSLSATWAEKQIQNSEGVMGEVGTQIVKVFSIQPQNGTLPTITERMRVRFSGDSGDGLRIISVNPSGGHIQLLQVITETGRD